MNDADRYAYRVVWSQEDGEYVGTVAEMPSLSWLADTPEKAFDGIRSLAVEAVADMEALGEAAPAPIASRAYSGKFQVRIPPELHRRLAMEAAEERVSLNRLVAAASPTPPGLARGPSRPTSVLTSS